MSNLTKIPLHVAAENFATICQAIDNGDLNETLVALFHEARFDLSTAVGKRICFLQLLTASIKAAEEARDAWRAKVKHLKFVEERVEAMTLEAIQLTGMSEVKSEIGRLCVQKNPEALNVAFETYEARVDKIIDPNILEHHSIPEKYLKRYSAYQLDTTAVKEDLQAGVELSWAKLTRGSHIRIRQ